ncbi:MAG: type 4a pilus biogenesis protein PilO [Pseudomonadota bacterium]|nr:type 4a pilus biogenesis protein PilO [Pseudomonadota bacterium]
MMSPDKNRLLKNLDFKYVGYWPEWLIYSIFGVSLLLVTGLGYFLFVAPQWTKLTKAESAEVELMEEFKVKSYKAANLPVYEEQLVIVKEQLQNMLEKLPSSTEVPALLDDVTRLGVGSGLKLATIDLQNEQIRDDIVELPFKIRATGNYNEIAGFVSSVAAMPRIVTFHDYKLNPTDQRSINVELTAKTYRYEPKQKTEDKK